MFLENNLSMTLKEWLEYHQKHLHPRNYRGLLMLKNPFDLIVYEEIIYDIKPTIIVEVGGLAGGSAIWIRDCAQNFFGSNHTKVISIDLNSETTKNIEKFNRNNDLIGITGDCNFSNVINKVKQHISTQDVVMVIEDSTHYYDHTINVLNNYKDIVTVGSYFIVEDGICDILPFGPVPGPMRAVENWIVNNPNYIIDRNRERYIMTYNPKGFLKRII